MRPVRMLGGLAVWLACGMPAGAQPSPGPGFTERTIIAPEVEVHSGPSPQSYATTKLRQGDRVWVLEDDKQLAKLHLPPQAGWLAIKPPPGSFSWINKQHLGPPGPTRQVMLDDEPVRVGSSVVNTRPIQEQVRLSRGALVVVLGEEKVDEGGDGIFVPIQPPPQEVRYIPASAVQTAPPPVSTVSSASPPGGPAPAPPAPAATSAARGPDPRWAQAEQAERAGNLGDAIRLYDDLGRQQADNDLRLRAVNRAAYLRNYLAGLGARTPTQQPAAGPTPSPYGQHPAAYVPTQATSQYTYAREAAPGAPAPAAGPVARWSGVGGLRRCGFSVCGRPTYALELEGRPDMPVLYASPQPGVDLEALVNRRVNLYGQTWPYGPGMRQPYMLVSQVAPQ